MFARLTLLFLALASPVAAFMAPGTALVRRTAALQGAESEVAFEELNGSKMRIGIIRTRWNNDDVSNLVDGIRAGLAKCQVEEANIFETSVPGAFELPLAARYLCLSGTVDAIICAGVLIKGDTMHFEFIADAVAKGLMNTQLQTSTPIIFGVLTCNTDEQVKARSTGDSNHGVDWAQTAVEMALLRAEALGGKTVSDTKDLSALGFGVPQKGDPVKKKAPTFF